MTMVIIALLRDVSLRIAALIFVVAILASCQSVELGFPGQNLSSNQNNNQSASAVLPQANGEVIGTGGVRVALLVPLTAPGNAGKIGAQQVNAAKLALRDLGKSNIQLVIKDTAGQAAKAQSAANEAVIERSSVILGPLFSSSVSTAAATTQSARVPLIAFSSDPARAGRGVYLMSFSPTQDIKRGLDFVASRGGNRIVALLPNGAYGTLAENAMRKVLSSSGMRLLAVGKYDRNGKSIDAAIRSIGAAASEASVIYIPDGGQIPVAMISALQLSGVNTASKLILGSGQWESSDLTKPQLAEAYYPGRDKRQFSGFSRRYKAAYGTLPSSTAGLAYDAVSMAAGLARRFGPAAFSANRIESRNGYSGVNGIFRFGSNGIAERGLAIYQVRGGAARIVSPAPKTFAAGS